MILSFLRLFSAFRSLETDRAAAIAERQLWQAQSDVWRKSYFDATTEITRLTSLIVEDNHKFTDTMALHAIGKRVHSRAEAMAPPTREPRAPVGAGRTLGRAAVEQQTEATRQKLTEIYNSLNGPHPTGN